MYICRTNGNPFYTPYPLLTFLFYEFAEKRAITYRPSYFFVVLVMHSSYLILFGFQRIDEIMKRTRKSDVSPEVKVGIQNTVFIVCGLSGRIHSVALSILERNGRTKGTLSALFPAALRRL